MRTFETGATRDSDVTKLDFEGFLSPFILEQFGEYMHKHRKQADGKLRDSDNWQKGIPRKQYMKSLLRHVFSAWRAHRLDKFSIDDWMAILFNAQGYVLEWLIENGQIEIRRPETPQENSTLQDNNGRGVPECCKTLEGSEGGKLVTRNYLESDPFGVPSVPV